MTAKTDLGPRSRAARLGLTVVALALLGYGTAAGHDNLWPFGPFSMYAGYYPPNGLISSNLLKAETADGRIVVPSQSDVGIARADIEGELSKIRARPAILGELAATYHRRHPTAPRYVKVWIEQTRWQLHDRAVVSRTHVVLVAWPAA